MTRKKNDTMELIRLIGTAYYHVANIDTRNLADLTTVEAFAGITGLWVRINAKPGQEDELMAAAVLAMHLGFATLKPDDFLPYAPSLEEIDRQRAASAPSRVREALARLMTAEEELRAHQQEPPRGHIIDEDKP